MLRQFLNLEALFQLFQLLPARSGRYLGQNLSSLGVLR